MSIQDLGSIGELIAAFATLVYLAIQIRHSSQIAKTQYQASSTNALQPFQFWRAEARNFYQGMEKMLLALDQEIQITPPYNEITPLLWSDETNNADD